MGWKEITLGVTAATGAVWFFRPGGINATPATELPKVLPTVTALKPIATAMLQKVAATPIPPRIHESLREGFEAASRIGSGHEYDMYIVAGVVTVAAIAAVYIFGHSFLEKIFGGRNTRRSVELKHKTPLGSVAENFEAPRNLVSALIDAGGKEKVSAEIAPDVFLDVKAVASIDAAQIVLANHPELLRQMNEEAARIEQRLITKARILG